MNSKCDRARVRFPPTLLTCGERGCVVAAAMVAFGLRNRRGNGRRGSAIHNPLVHVLGEIVRKRGRVLSVAQLDSPKNWRLHM